MPMRLCNTKVNGGEVKCVKTVRWKGGMDDRPNLLSLLPDCCGLPELSLINLINLPRVAILNAYHSDVKSADLPI